MREGGRIAVRNAAVSDATTLIMLMRELAAYEATLDDGYDGVVSVSPEQLGALMADGSVEALIAEDASGEAVGCATFFQTRSTWTGEACMYLEDLFVTRGSRRTGAGHALMTALAAVCERRGMRRIDWICSASNAAGLGFYERLGAVRMDECAHHRLSGDALRALMDEGH